MTQIIFKKIKSNSRIRNQIILKDIKEIFGGMRLEKFSKFSFHRLLTNFFKNAFRISLSFSFVTSTSFKVFRQQIGILSFQFIALSPSNCSPLQKC
jgi:hypothetical protein